MKKNILNIIAITALFVALSGSLFAQSGTITGVVKSGPEGVPMVGANIIIKGTTLGVITDDSGNYFIGGVDSGEPVTLVAQVIGYSGLEKTFVVQPGSNEMNFWIDAVTDIDNNSYSAVEIGSQVWIGENLKYLPEVSPSSLRSTTTPHYYVYQNEGTDVGEAKLNSNFGSYGVLYNWPAAMTACPVGWHLPTNDDWKQLEMFLGMSQSEADNEGAARGTNEGGKLKEAGTLLWDSPNTGATNESGFSALPAGYYSVSPSGFTNIRVGSGFWVATDNNLEEALRRYLSTSQSAISNYFYGKDYGFSVRCIKGIIPSLVSTSTISFITQTNALSGGNIISDGGALVTRRGVCWSISPNPNITNDTTWNGIGTGSFTSTLRDLAPNTTYYVRAYAINSEGPSYGENISFTTLSCPVITTTIVGTTSVCKDAESPNITFTGASGTIPYTFAYKINNGNNQIVTTTLGNSVTVPVPTSTSGTFTYTLVSAYDAIGPSCSQTQTGSAVVTVNPIVVVTSTPTSNWCNNVSNTYMATSSSSTATFVWTRAVVSGISNPSGNGNTAAITETLINTTTDPVVVHYLITPSVNGCEGTTFDLSVTVNPTAQLNPPANQVICDNASTSAVTFSTNNTGGVTTYSWTNNEPTIGLAANGIGDIASFTAVNAGTSPVVATIVVIPHFANGGVTCDGPSQTFSITVNPLPIAFITSSITNVSCNGGNDGAINLYVVLGGAAPYSFAWTGPYEYNSTVQNPDKLKAGLYNVTVTDANACSGADNITITEPTSLATTGIITDVKCNSCNDGAIDITASGGTETGTYDYNWTTGDGTGLVQTDEDQTGLTAGNYNLTVTDDNLCTGNFTFEVINPFVVTNVNDGGNGSLRSAIAFTNSTIGVKDTITFNIPGEGPFSIKPLSSLPLINDPVVIDGYSQPGASSAPSTLLIELDGTDAGTSSNGLTIVGGNSTIKGLVINRFSIGVWLRSNNNIITGNYIGPDITGKTTPGIPPLTASNRIGINIGSGASNNRIGGQTLPERNIISGNYMGIYIFESTGNSVLGNYIGVDVTGEVGLGNEKDGVVIRESSENIIGGIGEGNVISAQGIYGAAIWIYGSGSTENTIKGNYIGLNASGTSPLGNIGVGVYISQEASNNIVGGVMSGEGNVISGNNGSAGSGIQIDSEGTTDNKIIGNYLGTDHTGTVPIGNKIGLFIGNGASNNQIGDTLIGAGNIIANSQLDGILLYGNGNGNTGNKILSNSIYSNGRLGIDLGYDGVTYNDEDEGEYEFEPDDDTGPNNLQNYPVLDSIKFSPLTVYVSGYLKSTPNSEFTLQFFTSKVGDNTGYGEGQKYLGSKNVTTGDDGKIGFSDTLTIKGSWGDVITATATDKDGNTSEFSKSIGGLQYQIIATNNWPFSFSTNIDGVPNITDGSDLVAVSNSLQTWSSIATADIRFVNAGTTSAKNASATDGINLVSFVDEEFPFGYGVLAVAAKTLKLDPIDQVAQIIDADIVVNPDFVNDITYNLGVGYDNINAGYFDIQSVITHELGHALGLLHSGLVNSTMFFTIDKGITVRSLEQDDKSWASYRYPNAVYNSTYSSISGNITYGYGGDPVAGALVIAINTATHDSVHAYSDALGDYLVPGLTPGDYNIYIQPLDGDVSGYPLRPGNISSYIYCNAVYTDYPGEYYSVNEGADEEDDVAKAVSVSIGPPTEGINLITNKDITPPTVVSVSPAYDAVDFDIKENIIIRFSEPVDINTLSGETCYLVLGSEEKNFTGSFTTLADSVNIILFDPDSVLRYDEDYTLHVTKGVKDLKGNRLQVADEEPDDLDAEFQSSFTTIEADKNAPEITDIIPANGADGVFVRSKIILFFSEPMNKASVENSFTLTWTEGEPAVTKEVDGAFSWDQDNTSFTYTPFGSLKEGKEEYTITISNDATDLAGMKLDGGSFTFTTVPEAAPEIIYIGPGDEETGVTVQTPVVVDFSEPINTASVNSTSFRLLSGNAPVSGSFVFLDENSRVIFRPDADLSFNTNYTIELTTGIQDVSQPISLPLENESLTFFKTADKIVQPHISYLDPPSGVTGAVVTIAGSGFDPDPSKNTVIFNGISAEVSKANLTSLTTEVPLGAMTGQVSVTVNWTPSNTMHFDIIPESLTPCDDVIANKSIGSGSNHDVDLVDGVLVDGVITTFAYITNPDEGKVTVVNLTSTDLKTEYITIGEDKTPMKIDINPMGTRAYVTNFTSHDVSVIDLSTNKVINTISVGIEPYGIAVTPDGKRVYVANYYSENLSLIDVDPASGGFDHVIANVSTGSRTRDIAITPDAGMVVVTGDFGLKIVNSDPDDEDYNSVIANVSAGTRTRDVAITPDAGLAIVSTEEGSLLIVNLHPENGDYSDAVIANVRTGTRVSDVEVSGDGLFVYMTDIDNDKILVYKIGMGGAGAASTSYSAFTLTLHNKIPIGDAPAGLVIDADARNLYVIDGELDVDQKPTGNRQVTTVQICCGPISPAKAIGDLIIAIQNMINNGTISESAGDDLIKKLNDALLLLYAGKTKTAINNLGAFINKVNNRMKFDLIPEEQGKALIDAANAIIAQLQETKSDTPEYEPELSEHGEQYIPEEDISPTRLGVIYPNPFSQSVTINYVIAENNDMPEKVLIRIYDISGRLVGTLVDTPMRPGSYSTVWKGIYENGKKAPYGIYFVLFRAGYDVEEIKEIMIVK